MTHRKPRVDRDEELILLRRVALGETTTRIALIEAGTGMGKSQLVLEFMARCPQDLPRVVVDFKGGGLSLADVLFHVCDTFGWPRFPHLAQAIQHIVQPTAVTVTGNVLIGQNEISVALAGPDEQTRDTRRAELTNAFMADLRALERVTLIFDVFERCDPVLQKWFVGVFLPAVHRSRKLAVIIAGQSVPEPTLMWEHEYLLLKDIAPEHWQTYAAAIGAPVTLEFIRGCCAALNGRCIAIANILEAQGGQRP